MKRLSFSVARFLTVVLSAGEKIADGPPAAVAADSRVVDVYLGVERPGAARA